MGLAGQTKFLLTQPVDLGCRGVLHTCYIYKMYVEKTGSSNKKITA